jgi:hypothetical protein
LGWWIACPRLGTPAGVREVLDLVPHWVELVALRTSFCNPVHTPRSPRPVS